MEPLTAATTFATIVGLLGQFLNEGEKREAKTIDDYLEWLRRHDHQQLVDLIGENTELSQSIRTLLGQQHDQVMAKLSALDTLLSSVAGRLDDFRFLALASHPKSVLSDQAIAALSQMNNANAKRILETRGVRSGTEYLFLGDVHGSLEFDEPRFADDDMATLLDLNLLRLDHNKKGERIFVITRAGAELGK